MNASVQGPQAALLGDGKRLHLHHGPIDLIIEATGSQRLREYKAAEQRFATIMDELVEELEGLRQPCQAGRKFLHPTARKMQLATEKFLPRFITPMAAVAGAVADEVLEAMIDDQNSEKLYVNNGGDTAFYLSDGQTIKAAVGVDFPAFIQLGATDPYRGIATSGWRGRSYSLGIADSVSVIAHSAAQADGAATIIANAINLDNHPAIKRQPACEVSPDSDLGDRPVTIDVGRLDCDEIALALGRGEALARAYVDQNIIGAALLVLQGQSQIIGKQSLIQPNHGETLNA